MLSFIFRKILGRVLTIPLLWSSVYPSYDGGLVFRQLRLVSYEGKQEAELAAAERMLLDVKWRSLFSDPVEVEQALITNLTAQVHVDRPDAIFNCLRSGTCSSRAKAAVAALAPVAQPPRRPQDGAADKKPLRVAVSSLLVEGGSIQLCRGEQVVQLHIVSGEAKNLLLPLENHALEVTVNAVLSPQAANGLPEKHPVKLRLRWDPAADTVAVRARVKQLPVNLVHKLFPQIFPAALDAGQTPGRTASYGGSLDGEINLEYSAKRGGESAWRLL